MVFYMPGSVEPRRVSADQLTPRQIVEELDRHIVGQERAKRAVAIALRNRQRRRKLKRTAQSLSLGSASSTAIMRGR